MISAEIAEGQKKGPLTDLQSGGLPLAKMGFMIHCLSRISSGAGRTL